MRPMMNRTYQKTIHMRKAIFAVLLLCCAGFAAACSDDGPNVTYVIVTGEPLPQQPTQAVVQNDSPNTVNQQAQATIPPTFTPLPIPTETAVPTPDVDPNVALQIGDRFLINGYYEDAVATYRTILAAGDSAEYETRAQAALGMTQAALREGLFQDAVEAATTLIQQFPQDYRAVQAYFLRGDAYLGLSQWQAAIDDFRQYLTLRSGLIDSYVHERIGDAQIALNDLNSAFESYTLATDSSRSLVPQLVLREKVARLHLLNNDVNAAIRQYDAILTVAENAAYRADIEYRAAEAFLNIGETEVALIRMQRIVENYPAQSEALQALNVLLENGQTVDFYTQGRINYFAGEYLAAIEAFNAYTSTAPLTEIPAELQLFLGRAYRAVGNSEAALVAFQALLTQYPNDPLFGDALLETGRTRFLEGDIPAAIARYSEIAEVYSYLPETAAEALWRVGYLYGTNDDPAQSRLVFEQLANTYPNSEWATSGLLIAASGALNTGDARAAETLYGRAAASATGDEQASAYLQVGRLALERGDQAAAIEALNRASGAAPDTYFSARAQDILAGREAFARPAQITFEFDDVAQVTEAENWIRTTFGVTQEGPLWPLSPTLEQDARIVRGRELWVVGAYDEAETEFFDVLREYRTDGLASYQLSILMRVVGAYYPSQQAAANMITAAGISTLEAPAYIARLRYPSFYRDVIREVGDRRNIDPLLMMSLIRHESLFDTNATGLADEKGMTQVIPSTAAYIAEEINWPDYQHSDLFRPYAGIEFGAFYLQEQLELFDGNVYAALAAYNAGPGRAIDWLALSGEDFDAFMNTITISSVQTYIQLIYRNYSIYRALYGIA